jgi:hypothetical protein
MVGIQPLPWPDKKIDPVVLPLIAVTISTALDFVALRVAWFMLAMLKPWITSPFSRGRSPIP